MGLQQTYIRPKPNRSPYVCDDCGTEVRMPSGVEAFCPKCLRSVKPVYGDLTEQYHRVRDSLDRLDDLDMAAIVQVEEDWRDYYNEQMRLKWEREQDALMNSMRVTLRKLRVSVINGFTIKG